MSNPFERLPEMSRISSLLTAMNGGSPASGPHSEPPLHNGSTPALSARSAPRSRESRPLAATPLSEMFNSVNWNDEPLKPATSATTEYSSDIPLPTGGMALGQFFGLVNWSNNRKPAPWPVAEGSKQPVGWQASVETVLSNFSWGD